MRKLAVVGTVAILMLGLLPQAAAERSPGARVRRVSLEYQEPALGVQFPTYGIAYCFTGCVVFGLERSDRYVSLEVDDDISEDVAVAVFPWDGNTQDPGYTEHHYCTETDKPLRLPRWAVSLWVEVLIGACADGTPATATQGVVTAEFSTTPQKN